MQEPIYQFVVQYGYIGLFGAMVVGILGLPLPDEWLLSFAGYLVSEGKLNYFWTVFAGALGSLGGMTLSYYIGHQFGLPLLEKYGSKVRITPEKLAKVEGWFGRFGKFMVTLGYFIPGVRHITAISAGIGKWEYHTFLLYAIPGAIAWVMTFVSVGVYLEEHWRVFIITLHHYWRVGLILLLGVALVWWIVRLLRKKAGQKS